MHDILRLRGRRTIRTTILFRTTFDCVAVLNWPRRLSAQFSLRFEHPIRFAQQFPSKEDKVCIATGDDLVGLSRFRDEPDRARFDPRFSADATGKRHLITLADWDTSFGRHSARGNVDQIDTHILESLAQDNGLINIPAALDPVGRGDTDKERHFLWKQPAKSLADFAGCFQRKCRSLSVSPRPTGSRAAGILISPLSCASDSRMWVSI